jgi:prepilin peptidase CpaA
LGGGLFLFWRRIAGAGDIKLLAAVGLWAGADILPVFLLITALAGGLLALALAGMTWARNRTRPLDQRLPLRKVPIPYGVAIAIGGFVVLMQLSQPALFQT